MIVEIQALVEQQAQLTGALEAATRDFALRCRYRSDQDGTLMTNLEKQHSRIGVQLEAIKRRPGRPASQHYQGRGSALSVALKA